MLTICVKVSASKKKERQHRNTNKFNKVKPKEFQSGTQAYLHKCQFNCRVLCMVAMARNSLNKKNLPAVVYVFGLLKAS